MTKKNTEQSGEKVRGEKVTKALPLISTNAAGIDVGASAHYVAVPVGRDQQPVRRFGAFTEDLHALAQWLVRCGVETAAMESTGVYWIPLYQILEEYGLEVILVNARHVKHVPGRKSDVRDCQWLQRLHSFGLVAGSFRPEAKVCVLRSYMRQRAMLVRYTAHHVQHMQKALSQMNVQLHHVISDLTGLTGMTIMRAILAGERDRLKLAALKDRRIKSDQATIAKALEGDYREEHLFALRQAVELYDYYRAKIVECDQEILREMRTFESRAEVEQQPPSEKTPGGKKTRARKPKRHQPTFDCRTEVYRILGVDLTRVDGIDEATAQLILSEIGLDVAQKWPTEGRFASWLGLCPDNSVSGGKVLRRGTRKVVNRVANALRMCVQSLFRSKSALGAYARRMRSRRDTQTAITATAHKLARLIYRLLRYGQEYVDIGQEEYSAKYKAGVIRSLQRKAHDLGYQLVADQPPSFVVP